MLNYTSVKSPKFPWIFKTSFVDPVRMDPSWFCSAGSDSGGQKGPTEKRKAAFFSCNFYNFWSSKLWIRSPIRMETTTLFKNWGENFSKIRQILSTPVVGTWGGTNERKNILKIARSCPTRKSFSCCFVALLEPHSDDCYINVHYNLITSRRNPSGRELRDGFL
jgi:hypothetical protein